MSESPQAACGNAGTKSSVAVSKAKKSRELGEYFLPPINDDAERTRLDLQHEMKLHIMGGELARAPVAPGAWVLDVATGTGRWAIEYATQHPDSIVLGLDLDEVESNTLPPNCKFVRFDAEHDEWSFGVQFDYIHFGHVVACFANTKDVMAKAYDNLAPSGWVEFHDTGLHYTRDEHSRPGTALETWAQSVIKGSNAVGQDQTKSLHYTTWLQELGLVNICQEEHPLPSNAWPENPVHRQTGTMYQKVLTSLIDAEARFLPLAGLSPAEACHVMNSAKEDIPNEQIRLTFPFYVIHAQKPASEN